MIRTTPVYIQGKENHVVLDCATGGDSTSGGLFTGNIIDLEALPRRFTHIQPLLGGQLPGTTSTAGGSRIQVETRLQHGNSSGGGDMALWATDQLPASPVNYYSSEMSTDHPSWTTGNIRIEHSPEPLPLLGTGRYVRVGAIVTRIGIATATSSAQQLVCHLAANLLNGQEEGPVLQKSFNPSGSFNSRTQVGTTATNT